MLFTWLLGAPRSLSKSLVCTVLIMASVSLLLWKNITYPTDFQFVYHDTGYQLTAAINAQLCQAQHLIDPQIMVNVRSGKVTDNTRLLDLPKFNHISTAEYCQQHIKDIATTGRLVKNLDVAEGLPLYWLDRAVLAVFVNPSFLQLASVFRLLQLALIAVFIFYVLSIGLRWPSAWVLALLAVISTVNAFIQALNIHGFVLPCVLAIVALYGLTMRIGGYRCIILWLLIAVLELWLFYGRSSLLFSLLALNIIYICYLLKKSAGKYLVVFSFLGVKIFAISALCILAAAELGSQAITSTHPVIHSVILGLGVPDNSIARREKITWKDQVGLQIAQRMDPHIDTLYTQEYNAVLKKYYYSLWKNHTQEMFAVYYLKFYFATAEIIHGLRYYLAEYYKINLRWLFYPFALNGFFIFLSLLFAGCYFFYRYIVKFSEGVYVLLSLSVLAFFNLLENALLSSIFSPRFQSIFIFVFLAWVYVFWGSVIYLLVLLCKYSRKFFLASW